MGKGKKEGRARGGESHVKSSQCRNVKGKQLEWNNGQDSLETVHSRRNLQATERVFPDILVSLFPNNDGSPLQLARLIETLTR